MSTKIYNAYKVEGLTIQQVMDYLQKVRTAYLDRAHEFLMGCDKEKLKANYGDNWLSFQDTLSTHAKKMTNDVFNWTSSAMVYFYEDNIYIQFFGMSFRLEPDVEGIFENHLKDYHYQNQADRYWEYDEENYTPERIAEFEADWAERERVWEGIFTERWIEPVNCGLSFNIYSEVDAFDVSLRYFRAIGEAGGW